MTTRNVVVIGAGPAGLTASIYLGRANLKPLVITGALPGGQLTTTTEVENFPGFGRGIAGPKLMTEMEEQAKHSQAELMYDEVSEIIAPPEGSNAPIVVKLGDQKIETHALIVATGASPRLMGVPGEKEYWSAGMHTCAVCDGSFYRGKSVAVVGGGDSAMEEASYLSKICGKVTLIHRRDSFRASKIMQERVLKNPAIEVVYDTVVEELTGAVVGKGKKLTGARLKNLKTGAVTDHPFDAVFVAIGHTPSTKFLKGIVELDEEGYVKVDSSLRTSVTGIYAAGDLHDRRYRQAVTAAGFGCMAALEVERWLTHKGLI